MATTKRKKTGSGWARSWDKISTRATQTRLSSMSDGKSRGSVKLFPHAGKGGKTRLTKV